MDIIIGSPLGDHSRHPAPSPTLSGCSLDNNQSSTVQVSKPTGDTKWFASNAVCILLLQSHTRTSPKLNLPPNPSMVPTQIGSLLGVLFRSLFTAYCEAAVQLVFQQCRRRDFVLACPKWPLTSSPICCPNQATIHLCNSQVRFTLILPYFVWVKLGHLNWVNLSLPRDAFLSHFYSTSSAVQAKWQTGTEWIREQASMIRDIELFIDL